MKLHLIAILLMATMMSVSCNKQNNIMYKEDPRVYFKKVNVISDSLVYSFGVKANSVISDTVYLQLRIMGTATGYDREINIHFSDTSTAKAGYHFNLGPLVMPANKYETKIPVYLYRKPGLKDSIVTADFIIGASKDFQPGYNDKITYGVTDRLHYKISITDKLSKPANWDGSLLPYFGIYSLVKLQYMIQVTGRTDWTVLIYPNELNALTQQVKLALSEYETANGKMLDENGAVIEFP